MQRQWRRAGSEGSNGTARMGWKTVGQLLPLTFQAPRVLCYTFEERPEHYYLAMILNTQAHSV